VKTFRQYIFEKYTFGGTAFGLASIDQTTAQDQIKADKGTAGYEGFNQRVGSSGRAYIPAYSVASRSIPAGSIIKITDERTGEPVGKKFGNVDGIFRVDGTGGPQTEKNIDFFSGDNRAMYDYFASYGTDTNNLQIEILDNITPNSPEEQKILANLEKYKNGQQLSDAADIGGQALANIQKSALDMIKGGFSAGSARDALKSVLDGAKGAIGSALPAGTRLPF
jgi:hypothetical protein